VAVKGAPVVAAVTIGELAFRRTRRGRRPAITLTAAPHTA